MNNKIGLVTMCRKAGKLVMGMDMVKDACNTGKACAVFAATEGGFAKACAKGLEEIPIDENEFYSI